MSKEIEGIINDFTLEQTGWEADEDIMLFDGQPIGATISKRTRGHLSSWVTDFKRHLVKKINPKILTAIDSTLEQFGLVVVEGKCQNCGGCGYVGNIRSEVGCPVCKSSGKITRPARYDELLVTCDECGGRRYRIQGNPGNNDWPMTVDCPNCKGTGQIPNPKVEVRR